MRDIKYRYADKFDVAAIAKLRAATWGTEDYWVPRISGYMAGTHNPQKALKPRVVYIATEDRNFAGFIAGHLTQRYECEGELEWIDVDSDYKRNGVASQLLCLLAGWFVTQKASRVCVNAAPDNTAAVNFYKKHGAKNLNEYWLVWEDINVVVKER